MTINKKLGRLGVAAVASLGLTLGAASANADFISGSISFSDGFDPIPVVVSDTSFFDIDSDNTVTFAGSGDFSGIGTVNSAGDIDVGAPGGVLYDVPGFSFTLDNIIGEAVGALACNNGLCTDNRQLTLIGTVSGGGFDDTFWQGTFTANGSCAGANGACTDNTTYSATWSSSLTALERPPEEMPVPGALALLGIGLAGLGWTRRRNAR